MKRKISGFHQDEEIFWVAELECGHNQHVRHRPPLILRPWVNDEVSRGKRLGTLLNCVICDLESTGQGDQETSPPCSQVPE
ncbi:MAG: DUF3565 domain-containing protein [Nitrospina sp.]|nr:DUF3565 domain-containing protein [Nitrospina sp.]